MGDSSDNGFAKLVPGFDFLQNLAKGTAQSLPQMPNLSNWVAPTQDGGEQEKRIAELKAVHFWLDQNGKALAATIQALEVQKMTLATLQGMNFRMGDLADALKVKPQEHPRAKAAPQPQPEPAAKAKPAPAAKPDAATAPAVDPLQWWTALTQQFQEIATHAMEDAAQAATRAPAAAPAAAAKKAPARKAAPRKRKT
jgi:hypothetical protein